MASIIIQEVFYGNSTPVFTLLIVIQLFISGDSIEDFNRMRFTTALIMEEVTTRSIPIPIQDSIDKH